MMLESAATEAISHISYISYISYVMLALADVLTLAMSTTALGPRSPTYMW